MNIKIETEKCLQKGVVGRKVLSLEMPMEGELPLEYLTHPDCVWGDWSWCEDHYEMRILSKTGAILVIGEFVSEGEFQERLSRVIAEADRLRSINTRIASDFLSWTGTDRLNIEV